MMRLSLGCAPAVDHSMRGRTPGRGAAGALAHCCTQQQPCYRGMLEHPASCHAMHRHHTASITHARTPPHTLTIPPRPAGNDEMVDKIVARSLKSLAANGVIIKRDEWLKEAEACERAQPGMEVTCRAIVKHVVGLGVEEEDRERTWLADAEVGGLGAGTWRWGCAACVALLSAGKCCGWLAGAAVGAAWAAPAACVLAAFMLLYAAVCCCML